MLSLGWPGGGRRRCLLGLSMLGALLAPSREAVGQLYGVGAQLPGQPQAPGAHQSPLVAADHTWPLLDSV